MDPETYQVDRIRGADIMRMPRSVANRLYPGNNFSHLLELPIERVGIRYEEEKVYGPYYIQARFQKNSNTPWEQTMARYLCIPNGQVKNFMVAVRAYAGGLKTKKSRPVRIIIRGSKGGQGSGIWHMAYAALLSLMDKNVYIEAYDDREVADHFSWKEGSRSIEIRWIQGQYKGRGEGFDVLIDDAFMPRDGVLPFSPVSPIYSLKGGAQSGADYEPFLHPAETRFFSRQKSDLVVDCKCVLCTACAQSSVDYDSYKVLRLICGKIGHIHDCVGSGLAYRDLFSQAMVLRAIVTNPEFSLIKPADFRSVLCLQDDLPLKFITPTTVAYSPGDRNPRHLVHDEGFVGKTKGQDTNCPRLEGKSVTFVGVEPGILGKTKIAAVGTFIHVGIAEVTFFGSLNTAAISPSSTIIYVPATEKDVHRVLSNSWVATGHRWKEYYEYEFVGPTKKPSVGYVYRNSDQDFVRGPSIALYPDVVDMTSYPPLSVYGKRPNSTFYLCDIKRDGSILRIEKSSLQDPSQMIWRDSSGGYGPVVPSSYSEEMSKLISKKYLLPSSVWFPSFWTPIQIKSFEGKNHILLQYLRDHDDDKFIVTSDLPVPYEIAIIVIRRIPYWQDRLVFRSSPGVRPTIKGRVLAGE